MDFVSPPATPNELCDLSRTKPVIALSGGYIFNSVDSDHLDKTSNASQLNLDECLSETTDFGRFHYSSWSHCAKTHSSASETQAPGLCEDSNECAGSAT